MITQTGVDVSRDAQATLVGGVTTAGQQAKPWLHDTWKYSRKVLKRVLPLVIAGFIYPPLAILYVATGVYDVVRHGRDLAATSYKYFFSNGGLTWFLSPLNTLIDILSLPFVNKKIYKLSDFPEAYQQEIREVTQRCPTQEIVTEISRRRQAHERTMIIYKWYGYNNPAASCDVFQKKYKYILTVGVSTFAPQSKTTRHFGWLRAGIRVLYNIDPVPGDGAYIVVNGTRHTWNKDGPLFMFDDTVLHQSFNLTDAERHCLFIDVLRPSYVPFLLRRIVTFQGFVWSRLKFRSKTSKWRLI